MKTVYIKAKRTLTNALGETINKGDIIKTVELEKVTKISTEKRTIALTYTNGLTEMFKRATCDLIIE